MPAAAADADAIRALTRDAYAKWVPVTGREPRPMTANYEIAIRDHRIDLLYLDGLLVGLVEMIPRPDHLLIENVAVSPAFQGMGFGRKLILHAEAVAASLKLLEVRLYTNKRFTENIRLYQRLGFAIDREAALNGGIAVHMSKPLPG